MTPHALVQTPERPVLLLYDREVLVRTALATYLRECGFVVIETGRREEIEAVLGSDRTLDLAFLDIGNDSAAGFAVARLIRAQRPGLRVLMASNVASAAAEAGELCEKGPMLAKPYDHALLERNIRRLLAR